jgi:hypothetical protein
MIASLAAAQAVPKSGSALLPDLPATKRHLVPHCSGQVAFVPPSESSKLADLAASKAVELM